MPDCRREQTALDDAQTALDNYDDSTLPLGHGPQHRDPTDGHRRLLEDNVRRAQDALNACLYPPTPLPDHPDPVRMPPDSRVAMHPPRGAAFSQDQAEHDIVLMTITDQGSLATSFWDAETPQTNSGGWSRWIDDPNTTTVPSGRWSDDMVLISWINPADGHTRVNAFIGAGNSAEDLPLVTPWWDLPGNPNLILDSKDPPHVANVGDNFVPKTGAFWQEGLVGHLNIFGMVVDWQARQAQLREFFWDGGAWQWTDHGSSLRSGSLGPSSLLMTQYSGFLFAVVGNVQLYYWQPQQNPQWQWHDLGMPNGVVSAECPLALSHYNGETARTEINLFISGWDTASNEWHLFERHWNGMDIDQWDEWHDHGKPPDVNVPSNTTVGRPLVGPDDGGFQMTASVVWFDGSGALRINIFGSTHPFTDIEGNLDGAGNQIVQGGQLLEYQWDGAVWSWASATEDLAYCNERQVVAGGAHSGARVPVPLVITSAAVVTRAPRVHISVFGSSLRGTIWERFWDSWSTPNPQWALH